MRSLCRNFISRGRICIFSPVLAICAAPLPPLLFFGCHWSILWIFPLLICCMSPPPCPIALEEPSFVALQLRKCFLSPEVSTLGHADSCRLEVMWQPLTAAMAVDGCSPAWGLCGPAQGLCSLVLATRHWGPVQELFWENCRKEMEEDVPPVVLGSQQVTKNPNKLKGQVSAQYRIIGEHCWKGTEEYQIGKNGVCHGYHT